MENPSLPLDPSRENENTDNTEGEQGENDPKSGMSSMGRVEESSLGVGLIISVKGLDRANPMTRYTYPRTVGERKVVFGSTVMTVVTVMRGTSSTGGTDGDGGRGLELEELHYTAR